jgi:hypothetical protein
MFTLPCEIMWGNLDATLMKDYLVGLYKLHLDDPRELRKRLVKSEKQSADAILEAGQVRYNVDAKPSLRRAFPAQFNDSLALVGLHSLPGRCQIGYMEHNGCHQLNRVLTAK